MKKIIILLITAITTTKTFSQNNVGIGTASPNSSAMLDITSTSKGLLVPRMTSVQRAAIASPAKGLMVFDTDNNNFWYYNGSAWTQMGSGGGSSSEWNSSGNNIYNSNSGNTGIGTASPSYKLDLLGRMRFQHTGGTVTAGAWYDGTTQPTRSFIGTLDDTYMGMYGNGGAGWNLVMNVINGNTGIGTAAPSAKLDVNGTLRIRGEFPSKGASLVSVDANGNTTWQKPCAFKVSGLSGYSSMTVNPKQTVIVDFNNTPDYNIGLMYSPTATLFTAPVKGIYHFDAKISTYKTTIEPTYATSPYVQLMMKRNNITSILGKSYFDLDTDDGSNLYGPYISHMISGDFQLQPGDEVWVQIYSDYPSIVEGDPEDTYFNGRLAMEIF